MKKKTKVKKEKVYQVNSILYLVADGWVKAKNKEEAKKKWEDFCYRESKGLSIGGIQIGDLMSPKSKYYDHNNVPKEEDFENYDCITYNYLD